MNLTPLPRRSRWNWKRQFLSHTMKVSLHRLPTSSFLVPAGFFHLTVNSSGGTRFLPPLLHGFSVIRRNHPPRCSFRCLRHDFVSRDSPVCRIGVLCDNRMEQHDVSTNTVIDNPQSLNEKIALIRKEGPSKFQVIADFDATLTRYWIDGHRGQSSHGLVQQENPEYDAKRQALYEYYHPLEFSPTIPFEEKTKLMEEWWGRTHGLLIEGGLTFDSIKKSVANSFIAFREGVVELFEFLEKMEIPVLIFSAGLGDIIEEVLRQKLQRKFQNVKIVSNQMVFDDNGRLVSFKGKLIHVLNKNEHALDMAAPLHDRLGDISRAGDGSAHMKQRTNVLLLGDHIGDLSMSDGLNYDTRISVGFLNDNIDKNLQSYRSAFDMVYLNDAPMWGVVDLVYQLFSTERS